MQENEAQDAIGFKTVEGEVNPADIMTKHVGPVALAEFSRLIGSKLGRADSNRSAKKETEQNTFMKMYT